MTPARLQQAGEATSAFHEAMVAYGALALADSLKLWERLPAQAGASSSSAAAAWLTDAIRLVMRRNAGARRLGLAFYRYQRALVTGRTIFLPGERVDPDENLRSLRLDFERELGGIPMVRVIGAEPDDPIPADPLPDLAEALGEIESATREQMAEVLENLGPRNLDKKIRDVRTDVVDEFREALAEAHSEAGQRQAAASARGAMNGARSAVYVAADADKAVIGWVRVSKTGTPCGWCAMLISREVAYRSEKSALLSADGDKYHDNCNCVAVPVYSMEQYDSNPMFDLNREYSALWPVVTKGLSGRRAIKEWRRYFRQQQKEAKEASPEDAA